MIPQIDIGAMNTMLLIYVALFGLILAWWISIPILLYKILKELKRIGRSNIQNVTWR